MAGNERDATGTSKMGRRPGEPEGLGPAGKVDLALPDIKSVTSDIKELNSAIKELQETLGKRSLTSAVKAFVTNLNTGVSKTLGLVTGAKGSKTPEVGQTAFQTGKADPDSVKVAPPTPSAPSTATGMTVPSGPTSSPAPPLRTDGGPSSADKAAAIKTGSGSENTIQWAQNFGGLMDAVQGGIAGKVASLLYGSIAGGGLQYVYNRINGPSGNINSVLQASQALGPQVTMMNATGQYAGGGPFNIRKMLAGLANEYPVLGTEQDVLSTIMAGTNVGALVRGTDKRNGFYESVRQMQVLNPGQSPGNIANGLSGYISNTQAQQRGVFYGQGAFTMFGQGGSYKTLSQWAAGIKKFLEQQRGGGAQGKPFTRAELVTQNFPGSNINAWFQMMGVPQNMVDYWWQYVLSATDSLGSDATSQDLMKIVQKDRGYNLGFERLRNVSAGTQREFKFGSEMYKPYIARENADRRFNQTMGTVDQALGQMLQGTNLGNIFALMPTPIMELLLPILSGLATSPVGGIASTVGHVLGGVLGDPDPYGDPQPHGDPMPFGDIGPRGGTTTSHLSPDLAKKVQAMMKANPNLRISSAYRDTHTQNRLRRQGGPVARPSRSAHTRGWAVDIGPMSQGGWLASNAHKFGLQTAANKGEPWHVQLAGSMPYGDIVDIGKNIWDFGVDGVERVTNPLGSFTGFKTLDFLKFGEDSDNPLKAFVNILQAFTDSKSTGLMNMMDLATQLWAQLMLSPFGGFAKLMGGSDMFSGGSKQMSKIVSEDASGEFNIKVPSIFEGFKAENAFAAQNNFDLWYGDPNDHPYGDPMTVLSAMASRAQSVSRPIIFQSQITVNTAGSMTSAAAKTAASAIADHLEAEVSRRQWSVV